MEDTKTTPIVIETTVQSPVEKVWQYWSEPQHITKWCQASDDWHAPRAENDLQDGGKFVTTMAAKDGSMSFDFAGVYSKIRQHKEIGYTMEDGRKVDIVFEGNGDQTRIIETFDPESTHPLEMQRSGWQAILDNFKKYTENN